MRVSDWLSWLPFGTLDSISPQRLARDIDQFLLIDVRTGPEYRKSHIPGAISIPLHRLTQRGVNQLNTGKPVVCICLSAHRSKPAVRKFKRAGIPCYELSGGMLAWWKLKLPVSSNQADN